MVEILGVERFIVEKSGVEKYMVEKSGVEGGGWKVWGWGILQRFKALSDIHTWESSWNVNLFQEWKSSFILHRYLIHQPVFSNSKVYISFSDGSLLRNMNLVGPFILLRVYLDAFCANTPIGSMQLVFKKLGFNPEKSKFLKMK